MSESPEEHVLNHLRDAHAIEVASSRQLDRAVRLAADDDVRDSYQQHLEETKQHEQAIGQLIEGHDREPSPFEDKTTRGGTIGLRQLSDIAPETPVKLAMHMFGLEHLEIATYELLAAIARCAKDGEAGETAERLLEDERRAAERVAASFDHAAEAWLESFEGEPEGDDHEFGESEQDPLLDHLREVHALEQQEVKLLELAVEELTEDDELKNLYRDQLEHTQEHEQLINGRIEAHEKKPSAIRDLQVTTAAAAFNELSEHPPDTPVKLAMNFFCFEYLKIAGYELLARIAKQRGDDETAKVAQRIIDQEGDAAKALQESFDRAVELMFESDASYEGTRLFDGTS
jgi:ferritin-like metal-binding protein YciE